MLRVTSLPCTAEGDPHFKVAQAALDAVQAGLLHHSELLEASLDRLLPLLSQRITDPKEAIRGAAIGCVMCTPLSQSLVLKCKTAS